MKAAPAVITVLSVALTGALATNVLQYMRYSSSRPVVRIGDDVVTRKTYQDRLEYAYGKSVLSEIVYQKIILSAAKKAGVLPTDKDIDERIKDIKRRDSHAFAEAEQNSTKMEQARQNIASNIALENLRIKDVKASDSEVAAFYAKNKAAFQVPSQVKTTLVVAQNSVDAATAKSLLQQKMTPDIIASQPRLRVLGVNGYTLPPNLPAEFTNRVSAAVLHMKAGAVSVFPLGPNFVIIRANTVTGEGIQPLALVKATVARVCKLSKAPTPEQCMARLYKEGHVVVEISKYSPYFSEIEDAANRLDTPTKTASR